MENNVLPSMKVVEGTGNKGASFDDAMIQASMRQQGKGIFAPSPTQDAVLQSFKEVNDEFEKGLREAMQKDGKLEGCTVPVEDLAVYYRWRKGDFDMNDTIAPLVLKSLTSVASNGAIQNDTTADSFMQFQSRTDNMTHSLKKGFDEEHDPVDGKMIRKWTNEAKFNAFKTHFDLLDAGKAGAKLFANNNLRKMSVGLKDNEDFFELPHERQMEIVRNASPLYYGDRWQTELDGMMKRIGKGNVPIDSTDAGRWLLERALNGGGGAEWADPSNIAAFRKSEYPKTEEGLAQWLIANPMKPQFEYTGNADTDAGVAQMNGLDKDWLYGVKGDDGKYHVMYGAGGRADRDFTLKHKVIDDLTDTDGRYSAARAITELNNNPEAWSFFKRFTEDVNRRNKTIIDEAGGFQKASFFDRFAYALSQAPAGGAGMLPANPQQVDTVAGQRLNFHGTLEQMLGYVFGTDDKTERARRWSVCESFMRAASQIDRRVGSYWSNDWGGSTGNAVGRTLAGAMNVADEGILEFWRKTFGFTTSKLFGDERTFAADWVSKHVSADDADAAQQAKSMGEAVMMLQQREFFSDNTLIGGGAEFLASLEAMGPLFGVGAKIVGKGVQLAGKGVTKLGKAEKMLAAGMKAAGASKREMWMIDTLSKIGVWSQKAGVWGQRWGGSMMAPGKILTASQKKAKDALEKVEKMRTEWTALAKTRGTEAYTEEIGRRMNAIEEAFKGMPQADRLIKFSDSLAQFIAKIPAGAFLGAEATEESRQQFALQYMQEGRPLDADELKMLENWARGRGIIEGTMMAGLISLKDAPMARILSRSQGLQREASLLEKEFDAILTGMKIPKGDDATKYLFARLCLTRGFEAAKRAAIHNAEFAFTMEEANTILENERNIYNRRLADPDFKPTLYDHVLSGQPQVLVNTAKMATPAALSAFAGGAAVARGKLPSGAVQAIANSRLSLFESEVKKARGDNGSAIAKAFIVEYWKDGATEADRNTLRDMVRHNYGERAARFFDQLNYEVSRPRSENGIGIRNVASTMQKQEVTADGIRNSLSKVGIRPDDATVTTLDNGYVLVGMKKGMAFGGKTLDADKTILVRPSNMEGLHKTADGKFDVKWVNEIVTKHLSGEDHFGEFGEKYDKLNRKGRRAIARGEDYDGLLTLAEKAATDWGIYIPKEDERFGKNLGGTDANLVDGIVMLADADALARSPAKGLEDIASLGMAKGADVETFLHEYFHAITDMIPLSEQDRLELSEKFGGKNPDGTVKNWKEGFVDAFLSWHRTEDINARAAMYAKLNERGLLKRFSDAAKDFLSKVSGKGERDRYSDEEMRRNADELKKMNADLPTLDEFLGEVFKTAKDEAEARREEEAERTESEELKDEIIGDEGKPDGAGFSTGSRDDTASILEGFRRDIQRMGGFGLDERHYQWIDGISKRWINGQLPCDRYPAGIFAGFDAGDVNLARSLCAAALAGVSDGTPEQPVPSFSAMVRRGNIQMATLGGYKPQYVAGMKGFDPRTCMIAGGARKGGYYRFPPEAVESVRGVCREIQEENIRDVARENDFWFDTPEAAMERLGGGYRLLSDQTGEAVVWHNNGKGKVLKHIGNLDLSAGGDASVFIDRIALFNSLFPESKMTLVGWGRMEHNKPDGSKAKSFGVYVTQDFKVGKQDVTEKEVDALMKSKGFTKFYDFEMKKNGYQSADGSVIVRDINSGNVVRDIATGELIVIDCNPALNTRQNVEDGVVPEKMLVKGKYREATYTASWNVGEDRGEGILARLQHERNEREATATPTAGKPYVGLVFSEGTIGGKASFEADMEGKFDRVYDGLVSLEEPLVLYMDGADLSKGLTQRMAEDVARQLKMNPDRDDVKKLMSKGGVERMYEAAQAAGFDGVVLMRTDKGGSEIPIPSVIPLAADKVRPITACAYDSDGRLVDLEKVAASAENTANWNVGGVQLLRGIFGDKADKVSEQIRESFQKALDALNAESRAKGASGRKRIDNDELNAWLEKRKENTLHIRLGDGTEMPVKFYKGGADSGLRIEYTGSSARLPRNFNERIASEGFVRLSEFYQSDPFMFKAAYAPLGETRVYVTNTPAYREYKARHDAAEAEKSKNRIDYRRKSVEPIFADGKSDVRKVGVNEFGDIIIVGDKDGKHVTYDAESRRRFSREMNTALVKLIQRAENWETVASYSKEYFVDVLTKRRADGPLSFTLGDQKLKDMILGIVRDRLDDFEKSPEWFTRNQGLDRGEVERRVTDAIAETVRNAAKYFSAEMEASRLGDRFGVDVGKLKPYSEVQAEYVNALIKPYQHTFMSQITDAGRSQEQSRRVALFYRNYVMDVVTKALHEYTYGGRDGRTRGDKELMRIEFDAAMKQHVREAIAGYVRTGGKDSPLAAMVNADITTAKEYMAGGGVRGKGQTVVADTGASKREARLKAMDERAERGELNSITAVIRDIWNKNGRDFNNVAVVLAKAMRGDDKGGYVDKMREAVTMRMNDTEKGLYSREEIDAIVREKVGDALSNAMAEWSVGRRRDTRWMTPEQLASELRKTRTENNILKRRIAEHAKTRMKQSALRNAAGVPMEEVNAYFGGRDTIGELMDVGGDPTSPILDAKKFADDLLTNFASSWRSRNEDAQKQTIEEMMERNPYIAADFAATVAQWLKKAAYKCAYDSRMCGLVRQGILSHVAQLEASKRPTLKSVRNMLEEDVAKMVELKRRTRAGRIIDNIEKVIDREAVGKKRVKMDEAAYKRKVHPFVQEYWRQVKSVLRMNDEDKFDSEGKLLSKGRKTRMEELDAKWHFTDGEIRRIDEGAGADEVLDADGIAARQKALLEYMALERYGAIRRLPIGELIDKVGEVSSDILSHQRVFKERFADRLEHDEKARTSLIEELAEARKGTGGRNVDIGRKARFWRGATYFNTPDLFAKLNMMFLKGSEAYEFVEDFRRDMSLAHIRQEQTIRKEEQEFINTVETVFGDMSPDGKPMKFEAIMRELLTPREEYAEFSRADWGFNKDSKVVEVSIDGRKMKVRLARQGADPNAIRSRDGLSMAQLIYIYAACRNDDMAYNNIAYGRDAEYFRRLRETIGEKGLAIANWMRGKFDQMREAMSPVSEQVSGLPVMKPTIDWYFPLHFTQKANDPLERTGRFSLDMFPTFLVERVNHNESRLDETIDVFHAYVDKVQSTAHYVSFMPIIDAVKSTLCDRNVQTAFKNTLGNVAYKEVFQQLATSLCGGRLDNMKWLAALRNFTTAGTLFYNVPSAIKQFEGIAAWATQVGIVKWFKNLPMLWRGADRVEGWSQELGNILDARQGEGFSDVTASLKNATDLVESGKTTLASAYNKYKRHGLTLTSFIDRIASRSMASVYFNQKVAEYRMKGDTPDVAMRKAIADVDYAIQLSQQSARPEFQIAPQRGDAGGTLGRVFSQFAGPSYIRLGMEIEALHRWIMTRNRDNATEDQIREARRDFFSKAFALHFLCPTALTCLELIGKGVTHAPDDDWLETSLLAWSRNILTGPFSGAFVLGALATDAADLVINGGKDIRVPSTPMASKLYSVIKATAPLRQDIFRLGDSDVDAERILSDLEKIIEAPIPAVRHGANIIKNVTD